MLLQWRYLLKEEYFSIRGNVKILTINYSTKGVIIESMFTLKILLLCEKFFCKETLLFKSEDLNFILFYL